MDELFNQTRAVFTAGEIKQGGKFTKRIAFNVIPHIDVFMEDGYTKEEWKMVAETKKMLDPKIKLTATAVRVPVGTVVTNVDTDEVIGDLTSHGQRLKVAQGGRGGLGNIHFKSSVNRAPRKSTPGTPGDVRDLKLELRLLADVGLLGFPNAGKCTLDRQSVV